MWKCKKCGGEVIEKEINEYTLTKDKKRKKIYLDKYFYQCDVCDNHSDNLKDIAKWEN